MSGRRSVLLACACSAVWPAVAATRGRVRRHPPASPRPDIEAGPPAQTPIGPLDIQARWAIIVDVNTGAVILEKSPDDEVPPSSLTKLMTAYIVFGMLKSGRLRLDQLLPVSERAWRMQGSKMFVPLGQQVAVSDLIRGMIIQSGNDACIVLAEGAAGSEEQFVVLMNDAAHRLGLTHTQFRNATGWPDPDHHMSCRDIATLAAALIHDFPDYYHFFGEKSFTFDKIDQGNRNVLVDKGLADGLKTGHTDAGGFGLCASAIRDGRRIVLVLNGMPSSAVRVQEGERLLEWSFGSFEDVTLYAAGQPVDTVPVWLGASPVATLVSTKDIVATMPHGWRNSARIELKFQAPVAAPVHKGQVLGTLVVTGNGIASQEVELVAGATIGRMLLPLRSVAILERAVVGG